MSLSGQLLLTSINEGVTTNGTVAAFTDSDTSDTAGDFTTTIDWGDGTTSSGTVSGQPSLGPLTVEGTHTYAAVDHFTPDGNADLLFQNANGAKGLWELLNGTNIVAETGLPNPGTGWQSQSGHPFATG
jgi:hypothetical protein